MGKITFAAHDRRDFSAHEAITANSWRATLVRRQAARQSLHPNAVRVVVVVVVVVVVFVMKNINNVVLILFAH